MELTGEFGAAFVRPVSLAATHAAMLAALAAAALLAIGRRRVVVGALRATYGASAAPVDLAVLRIAVCVGLAAKLSLGQALFASGLPRGLLFPPYGMQRIAALAPPSPSLVAVTGGLLAICIVAGAIGLWTRAAMAGACLLGVYVLGVPTLYGKVNHYNHLLWLAGLLAVSDSGAALSVDAARRRRRGLAPPQPSPAFGVPLAVARLLIGLVYFFPGWWKLWLAGPQWLRGDTVRATLQNLWFVGHGTPRPELLASHALLIAASVATVAFELSFLVLIHTRRLRAVAVLAGLCFHLATGLVLGIWFAPLVVCYVAFVDWGRLTRRAPGRRAAAGSPPRPVVVAISVLLVAGVVWTGALARVTAWPFACYPIFAPAPLPRMYVAHLVTVDAAGIERPVGAGELRRRLSPERWHRLVQRIAMIDDPAERRVRAGALVRAWRRTARLGSARLRLYLDTDTTVVGEADRNPLARVELWPDGGAAVSRSVDGASPLRLLTCSGGDA